MNTTERTSSLQESKTTQLFLTRGLVAIAWSAVFAAASDSLTTGVTVGVGVLLVLYPLIDAVASLIDGRSQQGSARKPAAGHAAVSAVAAVALGVASTGTVADALAVFGVWAGITGAAQLVVALRRRAQFGNQWPMLLAGSFLRRRRLRLRDHGPARKRSVADARLCSTRRPAGWTLWSQPLIARRRRRVATLPAAA